MSNKIIMITGSEGNLGKAAVKKFKDNGWKVLGIDIKDSCVSGADHYIKCDVRNREALCDEVAAFEKETGPVSALFTAAGKETESPFEETTTAEWEDVMKTWLAGTTNACYSVGDAMLKRNGGKVMLLSPDYRNVEGDCIMNAAAAGTLHGFGKSFGMEVVENDVMVNVLSCGLPMDIEAITGTAYYLAEVDTYTSAQVIAIAGKE